MKSPAAAAWRSPPALLPVVAILLAIALGYSPCALVSAQQVGVGPGGCLCSISSARGSTANQEQAGDFTPPVDLTTTQTSADMQAGIPSLVQLQQASLAALESLGGSSAALAQFDRGRLFPQLRGGPIVCNQYCFTSQHNQQFENNTDFLTLSVGFDGQVCGIHADSYLVDCIGPDDNTQLDFPPGLQALALSSGQEATCALMLNYTLFCWGGLSSQGELTPPEQLTNGSMVVESVIMRSTAGCAIAHDSDMTFLNVTSNQLLCWGLAAPNNFLGDGLVIPTLTRGTRFIQVVLSSTQENGMWGLALDSQGQVWNLPFVQSNLQPTVVIESLTNPGGFIRISMGDEVGCGILATTFASVCWVTPYNSGSLSPQDYGLVHQQPVVPMSMQLMAYEYADISCFASMCAAIASNLYNNLLIWGSPGGIDGPEDPLHYLPPQAGVRSVTLGYDFGCALLLDARQVCFSTNPSQTPFDSIGQLDLFIGDSYVNSGNPFVTINQAGVLLVPQFKFQAMGVGKGLSDVVSTYLVVLNEMAEIGDAWSGGPIPTNKSLITGGFYPNSLGSNTANVNFTSGANLIQISAGLGFFVGLDRRGRVSVLNYQQPGQNILTSANTDPAAAAGAGSDTPYRSAAAGQGFWCLHRMDSSLWCNNATITLSGESTNDAQLSNWVGLPQLSSDPIVQRTEFAQIAAGDLSLCGILAVDRTICCFGFYSVYNSSVPPGGVYTVQMTRHPVTPLPSAYRSTPFESVSVGSRVACGLEAGTGLARCWGMCDAGQCNITRRSDGTPFQFATIEVGSDTVCGVTRDDMRALVCWGGSSTTAYFPGASTSVSLPPPLVGLSPYPSVVSTPAPLGAYSAGAEIRICPAGMTSLAGGMQSPLCTGGCAAGGIGAISPLRANLAAGSAVVGSTLCTSTSSCGAGTYCPGGSSAPIKCAAGRFGSASGLTTAACSGRCVKGFYCLEGTMDATQYPCPAGRYGNESALTSPDCSGPAETGWYTLPSSRSPTAFVCPSRGFVCPKESAAPVAVAPGYYSISSLSPDVRNASRLTPDQGMTDVRPCPAGSACVLGVPTLCDPGHTAGGNASAMCDQCPPGFYAPIAGMTSCAGCPPGRFTSLSGQAQCSACPSGQAVAASNATQCISCTPGRWSLGGQSACLQCPPQTFSPIIGAVTCAACPAPNLVSANGTTCTAPQPCPPGQYMVVVGTDTSGGASPPSDSPVGSCRPCLPGSSSSSAGSIGSCSVCPPQTYSLSAGATQCLPCPREGFDCQAIFGLGLPVTQDGYWPWIQSVMVGEAGEDAADMNSPGAPLQSQSATWVVTAALCPPGYCAGGVILLPPELMNQTVWNSTGLPYALQAHLAVQDPCIGHRSPSSTNALCGECQSGYVLWRDQCVVCPGVNVGLLSGFIVLTFLLVLLLHVVSQRSGTETKILLFFVQSALLQLGTFDSWLSWLGILNVDLISASGSTCIAPFGPMQHVAVQLLLPLLLVVELGLILAIKTVAQRIFGGRRVEDVNAVAAGEWSVERDSASAVHSIGPVRSLPPPQLPHPHASQSMSAALSSPLLDDGADEFAGVTKSYELRKSMLHDTANAPTFVGLEEDEKRSPLKIAPDHADDLLAESDARAAAALRGSVSESGAVAVRGRHGSFSSARSFSNSLARRFAAAVPTSSNAFARTLFSIIIVSFQHTCSASLYLLECVRVDGREVVFSQPEIDCASPAYGRLFPALIVILVVEVLFTPLALIGILVRNRKLLFCPAGHPTRGKAAVSFRARYGILYESYRPDLPYWQVVVLLRQVLLVGLAVWFHADHNMRFLSFSLFNCVSLLLHVLCRPYAARRANIAETVSLQLLVFLSLILLSVQPPISTPVQVVLTMLVLPFSAIWTGYILYVRIRGVRTVEIEPPSKRAFVNL